MVPQVFYEVMTESLFAAAAYKVYGKIMVDEVLRQGRIHNACWVSKISASSWLLRNRRACRSRAETQFVIDCCLRSRMTTATRTGR